MISSGQLVLKGTIVNGHELEQTLGDSDGQGGLAGCSPWVAKSRTRLSGWTELAITIEPVL